jgi:hypothetical protein
VEGVNVAWVRSDKGRVPVGLVFGIDGGLARALGEEAEKTDGHVDGHKHTHVNGHAHGHDHESDHQSEVEVLSITLTAENTQASTAIDTTKLSRLLKSAPKDEVYRIKAVLTASTPIPGSDADVISSSESMPVFGPARYILNWAFGRWTCTPTATAVTEHESSDGRALRMTMILARYESTKWKKRMETGGFVELEGAGNRGVLRVEKIA